MREVPSVPAGLEPKLRNVLSAVRESLNAAITNINLNAENLANMAQWIQPALDANLQTFNESLIQATLESAIGADGAAGINARAVTLTTPNQSFAYNSLGLVPTPATSVMTATAFNTTGVIYYEFFINDVSTGTATTTNTYTYTPKASFDSMPDKLEVQIREGSISGPIEARDMMTLFGLKEGSNGITVMLSNEAHTLPKSAANVVTYTTSGTNINVWQGATALTEDSSSPYANSTFRVTAAGTGITPGAVTGTGTTTLIYGDSSAMTTDPANIIFTIIATLKDGTAITVTKKQSLSFSNAGVRGNFTAVIIVQGKSWPTNSATVDAQAYAAIIALPGAGGVLRLGDSVAAVDSYPSPAWVLTKQVIAVGNPGTWYEQAQVLDGNLLVTGSVKAAMLQAGVNPAVSGTTMTGQGGIINSDGTFALGNPVVSDVGGNISYNGTTTTINGVLVATGNIGANQVTAMESFLTYTAAVLPIPSGGLATTTSYPGAQGTKTQLITGFPLTAVDIATKRIITFSCQVSIFDVAGFLSFFLSTSTSISQSFGGEYITPNNSLSSYDTDSGGVTVRATSYFNYAVTLFLDVAANTSPTIYVIGSTWQGRAGFGWSYPPRVEGIRLTSITGKR